MCTTPEVSARWRNERTVDSAFEGRPRSSASPHVDRRSSLVADRSPLVDRRPSTVDRGSSLVARRSSLAMTPALIARHPAASPSHVRDGSIHPTGTTSRRHAKGRARSDRPAYGPSGRRRPVTHDRAGAEGWRSEQVVPSATSSVDGEPERPRPTGPASDSPVRPAPVTAVPAPRGTAPDPGPSTSRVPAPRGNGTSSFR